MGMGLGTQTSFHVAVCSSGMWDGFDNMELRNGTQPEAANRLADNGPRFLNQKGPKRLLTEGQARSDSKTMVHELKTTGFMRIM